MIWCLFKVCLLFHLCVPVCLFRCYDPPVTINVLWTYNGTPSPVLAWPSMTWAKWSIGHLVRRPNKQNGTYRWSHKHNWNKHAMNKYGVELAWHAQAYIKYAHCMYSMWSYACRCCHTCFAYACVCVLLIYYINKYVSCPSLLSASGQVNLYLMSTNCFSRKAREKLPVKQNM